MANDRNSDKLRTTKLHFNEPKAFSYNEDDLWLNEILESLLMSLRESFQMGLTVK